MLWKSVLEIKCPYMHDEDDIKGVASDSGNYQSAGYYCQAQIQIYNVKLIIVTFVSVPFHLRT